MACRTRACGGRVYGGVYPGWWGSTRVYIPSGIARAQPMGYTRTAMLQGPVQPCSQDPYSHAPRTRTAMPQIGVPQCLRSVSRNASDRCPAVLNSVQTVPNSVQTVPNRVNNGQNSVKTVSNTGILRCTRSLTLPFDWF